MGAPKYKHVPKANKTTSEQMKKEIDSYKEKIFRLLQDEKNAKKAALIIELMLKDKK